MVVAVAAAEAAAAAMVEKQDTCSGWVWLSKELSRSVREVAVAAVAVAVGSRRGGRETEEGELGSW